MKDRVGPAGDAEDAEGPGDAAGGSASGGARPWTSARAWKTAM